MYFSRPFVTRATTAVIALWLSSCFAIAAPLFASYHQYTSAQHQAAFNALSSTGYRMVSLGAHGDPSTPLYAATWVKRSGPSWGAIHDASGATLNSTTTTNAASGYFPVLVGATGTSAASAIYTCVYEYRTASNSTTMRIALDNGSSNDSGTIEYWAKWARTNGYYFRWAAMYGTAANPLYAVIMDRNPDNENWGYGTNDTASGYQQRFNAQAEQWARPSMVALNSSQRYLSLYRDDQLPGGWVAYHDLTSDEYQAQFNYWTHASRGLMPVFTQGGGVGANARYAVVFASDYLPVQRQWTVTGAPVSALGALDSIMQDYMQDFSIRAGTLAVSKNGRLVYARAFTWSEPGYPITQPDTMFRIASCAKPITSLGIHQLAEEGLLSRNDFFRTIYNVQPLPGDTLGDTRLNSVRIWHLLTHSGGWDLSFLGYDPMFNDIAVNTAASGTLPVNKHEVASYQTGQMMNFDPGTRAAYSNYCFSLLGDVIETLRPGTYTTAIKNSMFTPLGASRPQLGRTLLANQPAGEARYHSTNLWAGPSVVEAARPWRPSQYGGWNIENMDAHGGWIMAAADYTKMLAAFDLGSANPILGSTWTSLMWDHPPALEDDYPTLLYGWYEGTVSGGVRAIGHNGGLPGTSALGFRRDDNVSVTVFFNQDRYLWFTGERLGNELNQALSAVTDWPTFDRFPGLGIDSFVTIAGDITLGNYEGPAGAPPVTLQILNPGTQTIRASYLLDEGDYWVAPSSIPTGTYDLRFRAGQWLTKRISNVVINGAETINVFMFNGDTNDDDSVDDADLTRAILDYGTAGGSNGNTDLNEDGAVDDADITIVILNYGRVGDT